MHLVLNAPYELALIVLQTTGRVRRRPSRAVHFCWQVAARQPNLRRKAGIFCGFFNKFESHCSTAPSGFWKLFPNPHAPQENSNLTPLRTSVEQMQMLLLCSRWVHLREEKIRC